MKDVLPGSRQQRRAAAAEAEPEPVFDPSKEPGASQPLATLKILEKSFNSYMADIIHVYIYILINYIYI